MKALTVGDFVILLAAALIHYWGIVFHWRRQAKRGDLPDSFALPSTGTSALE